eukprot:g3359.t1
MKNHTGRDGTPVTFSLPVDVKSVKAEYFVWTFSDGSTSRAECATPNGGPANEDNEHQTIAIIGDAGGWTSKTIASLHINGPLMLIAANGSKISADGLRYSGPSLVWENGVRLLDARLEPFSTKGETTRSFTRSKAYPNHCHVNFPTSTHRIRLLFDGGVSVDGVNPLTPTRVDLFDVRDVSGAILPESSVLGLADLGGPPPSDSDASAYAVDMDNYLDICLNLGDNDPKPASVDVICGDDTQISMPKGLRAAEDPIWTEDVRRILKQATDMGHSRTIAEKSELFLRHHGDIMGASSARSRDQLKVLKSSNNVVTMVQKTKGNIPVLGGVVKVHFTQDEERISALSGHVFPNVPDSELSELEEMLRGEEEIVTFVKSSVFEGASWKEEGSHIRFERVVWVLDGFLQRKQICKTKLAYELFVFLPQDGGIYRVYVSATIDNDLSVLLREHLTDGPSHHQHAREGEDSLSSPDPKDREEEEGDDTPAFMARRRELSVTCHSSIGNWPSCSAAECCSSTDLYNTSACTSSCDMSCYANQLCGCTTAAAYSQSSDSGYVAVTSDANVYSWVITQTDQGLLQANANLSALDTFGYGVSELIMAYPDDVFSAIGKPVWSSNCNTSALSCGEATQGYTYASPTTLASSDLTCAMIQVHGDAVTRMISYSKEHYNFVKTLSASSWLSWDGTNSAMHAFIVADFTDNAYAGSFGTISFDVALTTDDVVGHEWAHHITKVSNGLIYQYDAGAINEAFSDIIGEAMDLINGPPTESADDARARAACTDSTASGALRWAIGEDVSRFSKQTQSIQGALRDMWRPECMNHPGRVNSSTFYCITPDNDNGGVHSNSGVLNHAFSLLVDGRANVASSSPEGAFNSVQGIGLGKATQLVWKMYHEYLTPFSDYGDVGAGLVAACTALQTAGTSLPMPSVGTSPTSMLDAFTASDCAEVSKVVSLTDMLISDADHPCSNSSTAVGQYGTNKCRKLHTQFFHYLVNKDECYNYVHKTNESSGADCKIAPDTSGMCAMTSCQEEFLIGAIDTHEAAVSEDCLNGWATYPTSYTPYFYIDAFSNLNDSLKYYCLETQCNAHYLDKAIQNVSNGQMCFYLEGEKDSLLGSDAGSADNLFPESPTDVYCDSWGGCSGDSVSAPHCENNIYGRCSSYVPSGERDCGCMSSIFAFLPSIYGVWANYCPENDPGHSEVQPCSVCLTAQTYGLAILHCSKRCLVRHGSAVPSFIDDTITQFTRSSDYRSCTHITWAEIDALNLCSNATVDEWPSTVDIEVSCSNVANPIDFNEPIPRVNCPAYAPPGPTTPTDSAADGDGQDAAVVMFVIIGVGGGVVACCNHSDKIDNSAAIILQKAFREERVKKAKSSG